MHRGADAVLLAGAFRPQKAAEWRQQLPVAWKPRLPAWNRSAICLRHLAECGFSPGRFNLDW